MERFKKQAILNALGAVGIFAGTTVLVLLGVFNPAVFILAAIACCPMFKHLWEYATCLSSNPIRILKKVLPQIRFSTEKTEWNDEHSAVRILGKYQGEKFMIEAANSCLYVMISDMPWVGIEASDPMMPRVLEAINEVNANTSNMSVIMCDPNENGIRPIYTMCRTILPTFDSKQYVEHLMCDILNRRSALSDAVRKDRPYMNQRRGPVGFNVQPSAEAEEPVAPAAKTDSQVHN